MGIDLASLAQEARRYEDAQDELRKRDSEIERLNKAVSDRGKLHTKIADLESRLAAASTWRSQSERLHAQVVDAEKRISRLTTKAETQERQLADARHHQQDVALTAQNLQQTVTNYSTYIAELEARLRKAEILADRAQVLRGALHGLLEA